MLEENPYVFFHNSDDIKDSNDDMDDGGLVEIRKRLLLPLQEYKEEDTYGRKDCVLSSAVEYLPGSAHYTQGVLWSPDGTCVLTSVVEQSVSGESYRMVVHDVDGNGLISPEGKDLGKNQGTEGIYSYAWFPHANREDPSSFCYAVARRGHPVHVYDACGDGSSRGSYVAVDERMDEMDSIYSIAFNHTGQYLYGGGRRRGVIYGFDTSQPGRNSFTFMWDQAEQRDGIISRICCGKYALENVVAVGTYGKRIGLFDVYSNGMMCVLEGHIGGVTHMEFSADGNYLYTGARKDGSIYCWDVRYLSGSVYKIERESKKSNQKIYFDIEPAGRCLASGGDTGIVQLYDLTDGSPAGSFRGASDVVNGCCFHPSEVLLATSSGERSFHIEGDEEEESSSCSVSVWSFPTTTL